MHNRVFVLLLSITLSGCSYIPFFGDDDEVVIELRKPAELQEIVREVQVKRVWNSSTGSKDEGQAARLRPLLLGDRIAIVANNGQLGMIHAANGNSIWSRTIDSSLSGGVGGNEEILIAGNQEGMVFGVNASDGIERWQTLASSEIVAVSRAVDNLVVVRTHDSKVYAIDIETGSVVWSYGLTAPALLLRGASVPLIEDGIVFIGFDNGRLTAVRLESGEPLWEVRVAIPSGRSELERIVDIDGQLAADELTVYAVSFQGRAVAVTKSNGRGLWARDMSSIRGLSADRQAVYISDSDGVVWALDKASGSVIWKQENLLYRSVSAPAVFSEFVVVGDFEGILHVLSKEDGRIVGREDIGGNGFAVPPIDTGDVSYFMDLGGRLTAVSLAPTN